MDTDYGARADRQGIAAARAVSTVEREDYMHEKHPASRRVAGASGLLYAFTPKYRP
jgi:hypothetical protein